MDMNDMLKSLMAGDVVNQVSRQTGISTADAVSVMESVLPTLLKGMQGQANDKSTQAGFLEALSQHGEKDTSDISAFLKNVDTEDGGKIVNHLLGGSKEDVAAKAKKKSGIDTKTVLKIMAILAPLLMSKMGSSAKTTAKSSASGGDMLSIVGGLLDGVDASDVINIVGKLLK